MTIIYKPIKIILYTRPNGVEFQFISANQKLLLYLKPNNAKLSILLTNQYGLLYNTKWH